MGGIIIYAWLFILVLCVVVEAATPNLVTIWFIPAAFVAFLFAVFNLPLWSQIAAFIATGLLLLFTTKPFFEKILRARPASKTNTDALIGKSAAVIEEIDNIAEIGAVKIEGKVWSARNLDGNAVIPVGSIVEIKKIEGVKLMCAAKE